MVVPIMAWPPVMNQQQQQYPQMSVPNAIHIVQAPNRESADSTAALPSSANADSKSPATAQAHNLTRLQSVSVPLRSRIFWTVDARKLRSNHKQLMSPPFELSLGPQNTNALFKMGIYPKEEGSSFQKANGHGRVQVKCESEPDKA